MLAQQIYKINDRNKDISVNLLVVRAYSLLNEKLIIFKQHKISDALKFTLQYNYNIHKKPKY